MIKDKKEHNRKRREYHQKHKEEENKRTKEWKVKNIEHVNKYNKEYRNGTQGRDYWLKHRYNLSLNDWLDIWKKQDGKCAVCGKAFENPSNACIDHNHITGKVRGLLCKKCNIAIGFFDENINSMERAIKYIQKEVV